MPSLLCCSGSIRSLPISPDGSSAAARSSVSKRGARAGPAADVDDDNGQASRHAYKFRAQIHDTLLPGQLPDSTALEHTLIDPEKKTGVPLLEDTLFDSRNSHSRLSSRVSGAGLPHLRAEAPRDDGAAALQSLHIPSHLQAGTASFDADYRSGELGTSLSSISDASRCPSSNDSLSAAAQGAHTSFRAQQVEQARLLLEAPLRRTWSRASGHMRLYKEYQLAPPDTTTGPGGPAAAAAKTPLALAETGETAASWTSYVVLALHRLQREVELTEQLPRCPALLMPYRLYMQPKAVHVVYDGDGEYTDLLTYLRERLRLPEVSCRSVMRQLLQALAAIHDERWVHRNISTEAVWIQHQERLPPAPGEPRSPDRPPPSPAAAPVGASAAPKTPPPAASLTTTTTAAMLEASSTEGKSAPTAGGEAPAGGGGSRTAAAAASGSTTLSETRQPQCVPPSERLLLSDETLRRRDKAPRLVVKLGGLGQAARLEVDPASGLEEPLRELPGCVYHLAPEALSGAGYGRPADVWAAGVLLYMMLTGRPPFRGANELEVMTRVLLLAAEHQQAAGQAAEQPEPQAASPSSPGQQSPTRQGPDNAAGPPPAGRGAVNRQESVFGGYTNRRSLSATAAGVCSDAGGKPPPKLLLPDPVQELVVRAVLESCAGAGCREALAGMLVIEPSRRMTAAELLRLPWFAEEV